MQATQVRGPFINGFTTDTPEGKPAKKIKSWFLNARFMDSRAVSGANFRNRIHLSSDNTKSSFSQKTSNHRHVFHLVSCQSSSDCHAGPFNKEERLVPKNGNLVNNLKEGICDLMGIPLNQPRSGGVVSDLIILALPAIFGQAIEPLSQLMETAYIGSLGPVELASAGVSVSIFNIISKLFNIPLLSVTTSFVAEDISRSTCGESVSSSGFLEQNKKINMPSIEVDERKQLPSVSTALLLAAGIGILEAGALFYGAGSFLNLMGVSSASPMHSPAQRFLSLRAIGAPAVVVSLAVQGVLRGFKDTKTPLVCLGMGNLAAVFLLPTLIYSFGLGITGAAVATVVSQYIITFLLIWFLNKKAILLPPKMENLQFGGYVKSGGLLLGRTLAVLITMTLGTSMAARQGPIAMAAHQICLQVWLAVSLLSDALALSGQALIATSYSKGDFERVKEITYCVLKTGLFVGVALAILLLVWFGSLAQLFTKDMQVLQIVKSGTLFVGASQPINALAFVFDGLHYGVSDFSYVAVAMMVVGAISSVVLLCAPSTFGLPGVWFGLTIFMTLRMVAGFWRLRSRTGPWWFLHQDSKKSEELLAFAIFGFLQ